MHELAIAQAAIELAEQAARGRRVRRVTIEVGEFSGVLPEALSFCFDLAAQGTLLDGAELDLRKISGLARCESCAAEFDVSSELATCACGATCLVYLHGRELNVKSIELFECD
ncbi:hydrogenase maturation nickel metallochaperone HypA [Methylocystis bryophila]|uniref:Hydrogenase maturation factor HypA n=1 Tax=Methylocystis bryophila TaxID=655015 RepID=A0A1W6MUB0_9HYPH|nr:hydrogenase maturation nickel metallochaperone HypA [Methylocystis bryophila]ARN81193.1 hydrogenase maturation nickel metallochaperone HypA [Methylocystis bryophila]BDV37131.1 putative hydrogenase nickel incorporation protein HypA [Methylocystis bryophila]